MNRSSSSQHELLYENLYIAYIKLICYHYILVLDFPQWKTIGERCYVLFGIFAIIIHKNNLKRWDTKLHCYVFVVILRQSVNMELTERIAKNSADTARTSRNVTPRTDTVQLAENVSKYRHLPI